MKSSHIYAIAAAAAMAGLGHRAFAADTVVSVTQYTYDSRFRVECTATRMNPAVYASGLPASACNLGTEGTSGPDRIVKNTYDAADHLTQVDEAYGTTAQRAYARYTYTANGLRATEKDASSNLTALEYDGFDRLKKLRHPNTALGAGTSSTTDYEDYGYDANNNRVSWRRRNAATITYCFDNLNRMTRENLSGVSCATAGQSADVFTGYDLVGNVLWKRFASATGNGLGYGYNGIGQNTSATDMHGRTIWRGFNSASAVTAIAYPDGFTFYRSLD